MLVVPIKVDALVLEGDCPVVGPLVDFSRMPFVADDPSNGVFDVNGDVPFLAEELVAEPFADKDLILGKGVHLHWALPTVLTKSIPGAAGERYPPIPDRWLVIRRGGDTVQNAWLVESNFWSDTGGQGVLYPLRTDARHGVKSVYLGRCFEYGKPVPKPAGALGYLDDLTAIGHGDPSFASFYPHCRTVLGFHDGSVSSASELVDTSYDIVGWHSRSDRDLFAQRIAAAIAKGLKGDALTHAMEKELGIEWDGEGFAGQPGERVVYHAKISFKPAAGVPAAAAASQIAVANTSGEALSCLMACRHAPSADGIRELEDRLESLRLSSALQAHAGDVLAKFDELRHQEGFSARRGEPLWGVRERAAINLPAQARAGSDGEAKRLPPELAGLLHKLNKDQTALDGVHTELADRRAQLYSDWCKYMVCAYPSPVETGNYPAIDDVRDYIEITLFDQLESLRTKEEAAAAVVEQGKSAVIQCLRDWDERGTIADFRATPELTKGSTASQASEEGIDGDYLKLVPGGIATLTLSGEASPITFMVWVKQIEKRTEAQIATVVGERGVLVLHLLGDGRPACSAASYPPGASVQASAKTAIEVGTWHHLAISGGDGRLTLWIDGEVADDCAAPDFALGPLSRGLLGSENFLGGLSGLRAFSRRLEPMEIRRNRADVRFELYRQHGSRYWQPREPVVLLRSDKVCHSDRHGHRKPLPVRFCNATWPPDPRQLGEWLQHLKPGVKNPGRNEGVTVWTGQPWHPSMLEWEVEILPIAAGGNLDAADGRYRKDFLTSSYDLYGKVDLASKARTLKGSACIFNGRSLLTPHAETKLRRDIEGFLARQPEVKGTLAADFVKEFPAEPKRNDDMATWPEDDWKALAEWYGKADPAPAKGDTDLFLRIYADLANTGTLSQALSGFNDALQMHRQNYQLPVADPLGFEEYQAFTSHVADALGEAPRRMPMAEGSFLPIRSGEFRLHSLRLIDTFGQTADIDGDRRETFYPTTWPIAESGLCLMPPRFIAPARLDLRWLSAKQEGEEVNDHVGTGPICGWLLANEIDRALAVYGEDGRALGEIVEVESQPGGTPLLKWWPAPGSSSMDPKLLPDANDIPHQHLRRAALRIMEEKAPVGQTTPFRSLLADLDAIAANIDPENFEQHQATALLFGRPFAVVRARLKFRFEGLPALDQGWPEFEKAVSENCASTADGPETYRRETAGVADVNVSVVLGDHAQVNDGVVGYWVESKPSGPEDKADRRLGDFVPCLSDNADLRLRTLSMCANDAPTTVTILMDPRGKVHATTGVLPVKAIDIPPVHFDEALKRIGVSFLASPLITGKDLVAIPLPGLDGFAWSWLEKDHGVWRELGTRGILRRAGLFPPRVPIPPDALWKALVADGWIVPLADDSGRAAVVARDARPKGGTAMDPYSASLEDVEAMLDATHIVAPSAQAAFQQPNMIREGWLRLAPSPLAEPN